MSAETLSLEREPLIDPGDSESLAAGLNCINQLVLPIQTTVLRGSHFGEIASQRHGSGADRDGIRDYLPGDKVSNIDWRIAAQMPDEPLKIRRHFNSVWPDVLLVTDEPHSRNKVTPGQAYSEQALAFSAAMAILLIAQKESLPTGLFAINDSRRLQVPVGETEASRTLNFGNMLIKLAEDSFQLGGERQHLGSLLKRLGAVANESLVVVVSDFRDVAKPDDTENGWKKPLQQLKHQSNDIIAIEPVNPDDYNIDNSVRLQSVEGKAAWIGYGKHAQKKREQYKELANKQREEIDAALKSTGVTHIKLSTDDTRWFTSLRQQLQRAGRRASR